MCRDMYPEAYITYLVLFHGCRDYFECHEVLEDHWKKDDKENRKQYWVGLIQVAVTMYHYRRKNVVGAHKMIKKAQRHLRPYRKELTALGLDDDELFKTLNEVKKNIQVNAPYQDINLPINEPSLIERCIGKCLSENIAWGKPSDMTNMTLVNKHKLRKKR
ncbi:hypothetical protein EV207_102189 [Scopulibacillus darangshiensis]|uniref:DUF309 domain-containing protein n=1 Tax=Scopulibacillus darangshiensis TaxID=442528 RepID=A0A4R2PBC9_9BACL|nr:DUF309 domain-containing protein [Scopulibacillus darangshiensis]TCP31698.1 hypothetical protein EV207_102189 [Scopulibacillus darangshiensis]